MSINFNRPNIFDNLSDPRDPQLTFVMSGKSTPYDTVFFGPLKTAQFLGLQHYQLQRFVYFYDNGIFSPVHCTKTIHSYNISSILDVNELNQANNTYIEPQYILGKNSPTSPDNEWGQYRLEQSDKIIQSLKFLIKSPQNGEYYFVDGVLSKWIVNEGKVNPGYTPPIRSKYTYRYKMYRYGVVDLSGTNQTCSYKLVKVAINNNIQGVKKR